jgi:hypothetical protein
MPTVLTDHHIAARDAVADVLAAVAGLPPVVKADTLDDVPHVTSLPAVVVFCLDSQNRNEMSTNARDGISWRIGVCLMGHALTTGAKTPDLPTPTAFERQVHVSFNNKRLSGVSENAWCEVDQAGELFDRDTPAYEKIQSAVTVAAVGRYQRS